MAGDWIKMEVDLPEKPEVWQIAGTLGIDADAVVGKLLKVWRWFDAHTESGNAAGVTYALVDHVTGVTGFGEAMGLCAWLVQDGSILSLPNFDRHNGKTSKNRALTAKRVAKCKDKSNAIGNASIVTDALPREEKRREENKEHGASPSAPSSEDMFAGVSPDVVRDFRALRKTKKAPITETAIGGIRREAEKAGLTLEAALRVCCERGWTGYNAGWAGAIPVQQPTGPRPPKRKEL